MDLSANQPRRSITDRDCVKLFNDLVVRCDVPIPKIICTKELNWYSFLELFRAVFKSLLILPLMREDFACEEEKFQALIDFLSKNILGTSLEHIQARDLVNRVPLSLYNLLEIISACNLYLPIGGKGKSMEDEAIQVTAALLSSLTLESSSSSSISSSLTTSFLSTPSSSSSLSSLSSISPKPTPGSTSPRRAISSSPPSLSPERIGSHFRTSSSDSACICHKVRDNGINTLPLVTAQETSTTVPKQKKIVVKTDKKDEGTSPIPELAKGSPSGKPSEETKESVQNLEEVTAHRFALEIGYKLQRALKLEEATRNIEAKIAAIRGEPIPINRNTPKKKVLLKTKVKPRNNFIRKNFLKTSNRESIFSKPIVSPSTVRRLPPMEDHDFKFKATASGRNFSGDTDTAIEELYRQNAKLAHLYAELNHQKRANDLKNYKLNQIREMAIKRDARIERARLHNLVTDLERETCSKYLKARSNEQRVMKSIADENLKNFKEDFLYLKKRIKDQVEKEEERRKILLDAFQHYYQQQLNLIKEKIDQEEKGLGQRYRYQSIAYEKLRKELQSNIEKEIQRLTSSKRET